MESQNVKELVNELHKQRQEISKLRQALNDLDREKESWFRKKDEFSSKIRENIKKSGKISQRGTH